MKKFVLVIIIFVSLLTACSTPGEIPVLHSQADVLQFTDPFDYTVGAWPESTTATYGSGRYFVDYDGDTTANGVSIISSSSNKLLQLKPRAATASNQTFAALVTTTGSWGNSDFNVAMRTVQQLRQNSPANPWERAWLAWRVATNTSTNGSIPYVPQTFYYFYLKNSSQPSPYNAWEVGKIDPNKSYWDCSSDYNNNGQITPSDCDADNNGVLDTGKTLNGSQRFFVLRNAGSAADPKGDCVIQQAPPATGYAVGSTVRARIRHVGNTFGIYIFQNSSWQQVLFCTDNENAYATGKVGFYTEDARVTWDNFQLYTVQ
jgi:hypothetical protein